MCVYSAVLDTFKPWMPMPTDPWWPKPEPTTRPVFTCTICGQQFTGFHVCSRGPIPWTPQISPEAAKKIVDAFERAADAAKTVDEVTGQKDCVDPEKAKLLDQVAELKRRIEALERAKAPAKAPKKSARQARAKSKP